MSEARKKLREQEREQLKKVRKEDKSKEGRVIIGKNIPIHWGKRHLVEWELQGEYGKIESYQSRKEACIRYAECYTKSLHDPTLMTGDLKQLKVCPLYYSEGAIMNPMIVGWDECFKPTPEESKIPQGMIWTVKGWNNRVGRGWITVGYIQSQEIESNKLREIANKDAQILGNAKLRDIDLSDSGLRYWFIFDLVDWEE